MNNALDLALSAARSARWWGTHWVIIGIALEIAIEALWPDPKEHVKARCWCNIPLFSSKGVSILMAGAVVVFGLTKETSGDAAIDRTVDTMRLNQVKETNAVVRLSSGVRELKREDNMSTLRKVPAEVWAQAIGQPSMAEMMLSPLGAEQGIDDALEARNFAGSLTDLSFAGWKYHFVPQAIPAGMGPGIRVWSWARMGTAFNQRPPSRTLEAKGWDAAEALVDFFQSQLNLWSTLHRTTIAGFPTVPNLTIPKDGVFVEVGVNRPAKDILAKYEAEREREGLAP